MTSKERIKKAMDMDRDIPAHIPGKTKPPKLITEIDPEALPDNIEYIPVSLGLNFPIDPNHKFDIIDSIVETTGITQKDFVLPYERQIVQSVRRQDVHIYTHTCGAIGDRLEIMVSAVL